MHQNLPKGSVAKFRLRTGEKVGNNVKNRVSIESRTFFVVASHPIGIRVSSQTLEAHIRATVLE